MATTLSILLIDLVLFLTAGWLSLRDQGDIASATMMAAGFLVVWQIVLFTYFPAASRTLRVQAFIRRPHYIQATLQTLLYCYWGLYWDEVPQVVPLLIAQLAFCYGFEMVLSWSRYRTWRAGFGPLPVVLSINLFLWFRPEYYVFQFVLIALTYLTKEFVRWNRDGRRTHIFNPSAASLAVVSVSLLVAGALGVTRGVDLVATFDFPPNFFEVVFLLGLVVQVLFRTTLVTFGAVASQYLLFEATKLVINAPIAPSPIDPSVFLGLTLLVTDPSTSPKSSIGKFLFGVTYGTGIFFLCIALRLGRQPSFIDKIVMVPVVNLLTPAFDRLANNLTKWLPRRATNAKPGLLRFTSIAAYILLFLAILPALKSQEKQRSPLPPPAINFSTQVSRQFVNNVVSRELYPQVYQPFSFYQEWQNFTQIRTLLVHGRVSRPLTQE